MRLKKFIYSSLIGLALNSLCAASAYALLIEGNSSGIFTNPTGPNGMASNEVSGTNYFAWGDGSNYSAPSSLTFSGSSFSANTETFFDIAQITYFNGITADTPQADAVDLELTLSLTMPSGINHSFTICYPLSLIRTLNNGTPEQNADSVIVSSNLPLETFFYDGLDYTVGVEFGAITGDGFSRQTAFTALEGSYATMNLKAVVTQVVPYTSNIQSITTEVVPEPDTLALLSFGFAGIGLTRRRTKT